MDPKMKRRTFIAAGTATALGVVGSVTRRQSETASTASTAPLSTSSLSTALSMPERVLGGTSVSVPILGLGGGWTNPAFETRRRGKCRGADPTGYRVGDSLL